MGDELNLVDGVAPKTPFAAWALERLLGRHGAHPKVLAAVDRATERGLHNQDLVEFRRVIHRLRKARPAGAC